MATKLIIKKLRMNSAGAIQTLQDPRVQANLAERAAKVQQALPTESGEEWAVSTFKGRDRAQAIVRTANQAAREAAADKGTVLVGALGAGR